MWNSDAEELNDTTVGSIAVACGRRADFCSLLVDRVMCGVQLYYDKAPAARHAHGASVA